MPKSRFLIRRYHIRSIPRNHKPTPVTTFAFIYIPSHLSPPQSCSKAFITTHGSPLKIVIYVPKVLFLPHAETDFIDIFDKTGYMWAFFDHHQTFGSDGGLLP